jgi:hypothetical protein
MVVVQNLALTLSVLDRVPSESQSPASMGAVPPRAPRRIAAPAQVDDASGVSFPGHSRIGSTVLIGSDRTLYIVYMLMLFALIAVRSIVTSRVGRWRSAATNRLAQAYGLRPLVTTRRASS